MDMTAIVQQVLLTVLIVAYLLQVAMMNVVTVPNVALEKAIANPMMNVKADLFVERRIVDLDIQMTTIVVPLQV